MNKPRVFNMRLDCGNKKFPLLLTHLVSFPDGVTLYGRGKSHEDAPEGPARLSFFLASGAALIDVGQPIRYEVDGQTIFDGVVESWDLCGGDSGRRIAVTALEEQA